MIFLSSLGLSIQFGASSTPNSSHQNNDSQNNNTQVLGMKKNILATKNEMVDGKINPRRANSISENVYGLLKEERSCKEERNVELYILYNVEDVLHIRAPIIHTVNGEER